MPYPYLPDDELTWTTSSGQLSNEYAGSPTSSNPRELYEFEYQLQASFTGVDSELEYSIVSGQLPLNLSLNTETGFISGTVIDLDEWVDGWTNKPQINKDGSNYASTGSAAAGQYLAEFTVRVHVTDAPDDELFLDRDFSILVINNYSSDRDQFIRDYSAQFGDTFQIDGQPVNAERYLEYQKSLGNFPALSNV